MKFDRRILEIARGLEDYPDVTAKITGEEHVVLQAFRGPASRDLDALAASIYRFGLISPIIVGADGLLMDGRERLRILSGLLSSDADRMMSDQYKPTFVVFHGGPDDQRRLVAEINIGRRHMTESDRAMAAARAGGRSTTSKRSRKTAPVLFTLKDRASLFRVGQSSVQRAEIVLNSHNPWLIRKVDDGKVTVNAAWEEIRDARREGRTSYRPDGGPETAPNMGLSAPTDGQADRRSASATDAIAGQAPVGRHDSRRRSGSLSLPTATRAEHASVASADPASRSCGVDGYWDRSTWTWLTTEGAGSGHLRFMQDYLSQLATGADRQVADESLRI